MAKQADIKVYLDGNVADTVALIKGDVESGELSKDDLLMLQDAEAEGGKRKGVLGDLAKLIDAAPADDSDAADSGADDITNLDDLDDAEVDPNKADELDAADSDADEDATDKEDRGEVIHDYMKQDYSGPLTSEQAMWRNENLTTK